MIILTAEQIKQYKDIGNKIDANKLTPIIEQAQMIDIKNHLGDLFYFDVISNITNPEYADLFSGCSFTYYGYEYYQDGLNKLLADFFMSKYVLQINVNLTPFGATTKLSQDSEIADRNSLKDISTQQLQLAASRWELIKKYLDANHTKYPKWKYNITSIDGEGQSQSFFKIRKI